MSRGGVLQGSVRARRDEDWDGELDADEMSNSPESEIENPTDEEAQNSLRDAERSGSNAISDTSSVEAEGDQASLKDISFGALAKAQESLATGSPRPGKRKRNFDTILDDVGSAHENNSTAAKPIKSSKASSPPPSRSSKHAPQTLSTRRAVTRKRTVFQPPASQKARDPRFDPAIISSSRDQLPLESERVNKNYSFLTDYRQAELQSLQSQVKAAEKPLQRGAKKKKRTAAAAAAAAMVDEEKVAGLKREIQSLSARLASSDAKNREREIQRAHKRREREDIREGRKSQPYYLKRGQVRKEAQAGIDDGKGKRAIDKKEERRRKREKGKEGRGMPRFRRGVVGGVEGTET